MGRTTLLKRSLTLLAAAAAVAGFAVNDAGATASSPQKVPNNLTVKQFVADGGASGHTKVLVDVTNSGAAASNVVVTGLLSTSSSSIGILPSGSGWVCALQGAPAGYAEMYTCTRSSLAANTTNRLTIDMGGTAGTAFTNFVSVGEQLPGESSVADNTNSLSSYYGPRADLVVTNSGARTAPSGHAIITTTTRNDGPWTASNLQLVVEVKATGGLSASAVSSSPSAACQIIPPAAGFNLAFSCTMNGTLAPRKSWVIKIDYAGPAGGAVQIVSKTTALSPADPVSTNNSATSNTHFHA